MLLYLHGFASSPASYKGAELQRRFAAVGETLHVPALDEGDFEHLTIGKQRRLVERILVDAPRPHVIIGSSMGGYVAALHASTHPVDALVLMAPAIDFAKRLAARYGAIELGNWEKRGFAEVQHHGLGGPARLSFDLMRDASAHEPWPQVSGPVLVVQGLKDEVVHPPTVERWVSVMPRARYVTYDAGHELVDVFEPIYKEIRDFLGLLPTVVDAHPGIARLP